MIINQPSFINYVLFYDQNPLVNDGQILQKSWSHATGFFIPPLLRLQSCHAPAGQEVWAGDTLLLICVFVAFEKENAIKKKKNDLQG